MTLDELKEAAITLAEELPRTQRDGDHYRYWNEIWQARIEKLKKEFFGGAKQGSPIWDLRSAQFHAVFSADFRRFNWESSREEIEARLEKAKAIKKADAIVKGPSIIPEPLLEEQALFFQMLPVNPTTGLKNPNAPSVEAFVILDCIVDNILTNPKYEYGKNTQNRDAILLSPVEFDVSTTAVRKKTGLKKFSNVKQREAFKNLRDVEFSLPHTWNPDKGKHGGWECKKVTTFHSLVPREGSSEEEWQKRGAPSKTGDNEQFRFKGVLTGPVGEVLILNAVFNKRFLPIPQKAYAINRNAQILYRQGTLFANSRTGWLLTYAVACRALGWDENDKEHRWEYVRRIEGKYFPELQKAFGWRRSREWESIMRKAGKIDEGKETGWVLKAPRQLKGKRRIKHLATHSA